MPLPSSHHQAYHERPRVSRNLEITTIQQQPSGVQTITGLRKMYKPFWGFLGCCTESSDSFFVMCNNSSRLFPAARSKSCPLFAGETPARLTRDGQEPLTRPSIASGTGYLCTTVGPSENLSNCLLLALLCAPTKREAVEPRGAARCALPPRGATDSVTRLCRATFATATISSL